MTRQELRVFLQDWFCGCGSPEDACAALLRLLDLHPLYQHREELEAWIPDNGIRMLVLYHLDRLDLTEHGGTVEGAWLTADGTRVRDALRAEAADGFEALNEMSCAHGYDIEDASHVCM